MPGSGDIIVKRKNFCLHHINYNWPLSNTGLNYMGTLYTDFFIQLALYSRFHICGFSQLRIKNSIFDLQLGIRRCRGPT